jgi:two-component system chemotaxis response regulator CheY
VSKKILIVDDSEIIRNQLKQTLTDGGYEVVEGVDGVDGLSKAKESTVDLVITDFNMPNMDGLEMSKAIKELPEYTAINIIVLTTESSPDLKKRGKEAGVRAWVLKPINDAMIIKTLGKLLS